MLILPHQNSKDIFKLISPVLFLSKNTWQFLWIVWPYFVSWIYTHTYY